MGLLRWLRYGIPARLGAAPVRYKDFSSKDSNQFDEYVRVRCKHPSKQVVLDWLEAEASLGPQFSLLDIGCGPGVFAHMIREHPALGGRVSYTGVDQSENAIGYCRERFDGKAAFLCRDVLRDGLPEGPFDVIVSHEVVEHLPHYRALVAMSMAKTPKVFALSCFAVDPARRWNRIRWLPRTACYMNYYAFGQIHADIRRLAGGRPLLMADLGSFEDGNNTWFPTKTHTVFYVRLAAGKAQPVTAPATDMPSDPPRRHAAA